MGVEIGPGSSGEIGPWRLGFEVSWGMGGRWKGWALWGERSAEMAGCARGCGRVGSVKGKGSAHARLSADSCVEKQPMMQPALVQLPAALQPLLPPAVQVVHAMVSRVDGDVQDSGEWVDGKVLSQLLSQLGLVMYV